MSAIAPPSFEVISQDVHGDPVSCSFCTRHVPIVVVLPLARRLERRVFEPGREAGDGPERRVFEPRREAEDGLELDQQIVGSDSEQLWLGLCAYCVLGMARALARNSNQRNDSNAT